eukprot:TRINITY_DN6462_c0_g1_i1.p1 TRINITY_DN6462_c0_g1~~TRINITY_DN6462_c0_g1_i1.p1  ORF type:complete len:468 (+),score=125.76 TRINITY_DN6462_c0_g1_i1:28-1431(+)
MFARLIAFIFLAVVSTSASTNPEVTPFQISIPQEVLDDLQTRLEITRLPTSVDNTWNYGANLDFMKELLDFWKNTYNWREEEAKLNQMSQYKVNIDGLDIHFVHEKSRVPGAKPLLMIHGWPGSFWECSKVLPLLVDPEAHGGSAADAFDLICPSLPGYGFSDSPKAPGFDQGEAAKIFVKLMDILYPEQKYYIQGGDWGSFVGSLMTKESPERVLGYHTNFAMGNAPWGHGLTGFFHALGATVAPSWFLTPKEIEFLAQQQSFTDILLATGYLHLQATKPLTISYSMNDSPLGLAAYFTEKFQEWTDCNGNLTSSFSHSELLTNIMIYWTTNTFDSSVRFYYECINGKNKVAQELFGPHRVHVPTGVSVFPGELFPAIESFAKYIYTDIKLWNIHVPTGVSVFPGELFPAIESFAKYIYTDIKLWNIHEKGGHFAAMEEPVALVNDLREFRAILENRYETICPNLL